jgi:hypothetical protein
MEFITGNGRIFINDGKDFDETVEMQNIFTELEDKEFRYGAPYRRTDCRKRILDIQG